MLVLYSFIDINYLNWYNLSKNPNAIDILNDYQNKINWDGLSCNLNAIELLKNNLDKINWKYLNNLAVLVSLTQGK